MFIPLIVLLSIAGKAPISRPPCDPHCAVVRTDDLNLLSDRGAAALRRRVDGMVLTLSGGWSSLPGSMLPDPSLEAARRKARQQADATIAAARNNANSVRNRTDA